MDIVRKIRETSTNIRKNWCTTGRDKADKLQEWGLKAISEGRGSVAWRNYMNQFSPTAAELIRLMGNDAEYMNKVWGEPSLAYIVANGICTQFSFANTVRDMDDEMLTGIDAEPTVPLVGEKDAISASDTNNILPDEREDI